MKASACFPKESSCPCCCLFVDMVTSKCVLWKEDCMEFWFGRPACTSDMHPSTAAPPRALHRGTECTHQNLGDTKGWSRGHTGKQEEKKDVSQTRKDPKPEQFIHTAGTCNISLIIISTQLVPAILIILHYILLAVTMEYTVLLKT